MTFWARITKALDRIEQEKPQSFAAVKAILDADGNPDGTDHGADTFFAGSGGDRQLRESLAVAGWHVVWSQASYYYRMQSPTGHVLAYTEGDVDNATPRGIETGEALIAAADEQAAAVTRVPEWARQPLRSTPDGHAEYDVPILARVSADNIEQAYESGRRIVRTIEKCEDGPLVGLYVPDLPLPEGDEVTDTSTDGEQAGYEEAQQEERIDGARAALQAYADSQLANYGINYGTLSLGSMPELLPALISDLMHLADEALSEGYYEGEADDDATGSGVLFDAVENALHNYVTEVEDRRRDVRQQETAAAVAACTDPMHDVNVGLLGTGHGKLC